MSAAFLAFLIMNAVFLLLTLAAAVRSVWHFFRPPAAAAAGIAKYGEPSAVGDGLLLIGVATSWYSVAGGWTVQRIIYPMYVDFARVGPEAFHAFGLGYRSRLGPSLLPVGMMCLAWVLLLWMRPGGVPRGWVWAIVLLCVGTVAVTPFAALAQEHMQAQGFSETLYARLMWSNAIRSALFTAIGLLSLATVRSRWATGSNH